MTDDQPFIKAILLAPDDDSPRLVYADWLDERGQPEKAYYIRDRCANGQMYAYEPGRPAEATVFLTREHEPFLLIIEPARGMMAYETRGGFVEGVLSTAADWLHHGKQIVRCQPINLLNFTDARTEAHADMPWTHWPTFVGIAKARGLTLAQISETFDQDLGNAALLWARQEPCPECDGEGFWVNLFYQRVNCGRCNGKGSIDFRTFPGKSPAPAETNIAP